MSDAVVGVYYRPTDHEEAEEALHRQLQAASLLQELVLTKDFNHSDICSKSNAARHTEPRRFLQCVEDNFLVKMWTRQ